MPNKRYLMGILFPAGARTDADLEEEHPDVDGASKATSSRTTLWRCRDSGCPSSIGLSLFIDGDASGVTCRRLGSRVRPRLGETTALPAGKSLATRELRMSSLS